MNTASRRQSASLSQMCHHFANQSQRKSFVVVKGSHFLLPVGFPFIRPVTSRQIEGFPCTLDIEGSIHLFETVSLQRVPGWKIDGFFCDSKQCTVTAHTTEIFTGRTDKKSIAKRQEMGLSWKVNFSCCFCQFCLHIYLEAEDMLFSRGVSNLGWFGEWWTFQALGNSCWAKMSEFLKFQPWEKISYSAVISWNVSCSLYEIPYHMSDKCIKNAPGNGHG